MAHSPIANIFLRLLPAMLLLVISAESTEANADKWSCSRMFVNLDWV